jgi:hypothetical protein
VDDPHYITAMEDDPLLSETNVEGTWMDPKYMLRYWEAQHVGLWHWAYEPYWDWIAEVEKRFQ